MRDAALDLALQHQRVDDPSAVVDDDVLEDLEPERLRVDPYIRRVAARRPRGARRAVVAGGLQARLLAVLQRRARPRFGGELGRGFGAASECVADRVRQHRHGGQRNPAVG